MISIIHVAKKNSDFKVLMSPFSCVVMKYAIIPCYGVSLHRMAAMNESPSSEVPRRGLEDSEMAINKHQAGPVCEK